MVALASKEESPTTEDPVVVPEVQAQQGLLIPHSLQWALQAAMASQVQ